MSLAAALAALIITPATAPSPTPAPANVALASWYDDSGATASGIHYAYGFASLMFGSRWGHRIEFCYRGRCVVGRLDDHGPYVGGRGFDLDEPLKWALGCPDLCWLRWREWRAPGARMVWR